MASRAKPLDRARANQRGVTPPATLLEVGCGSGAVAGFLHGRGYAVTGIDTAAPLVKKASERFPDANFIVGDVGRFEEGRSTRLAYSMSSSISMIRRG